MQLILWCELFSFLVGMKMCARRYSLVMVPPCTFRVQSPFFSSNAGCLGRRVKVQDHKLADLPAGIHLEAGSLASNSMAPRICCGRCSS